MQRLIGGWGRDWQLAATGQSGGVAWLNHRLQAGTPAGVRYHLVWVPVVSLVDSLNHRLL
jgi:hypothetical protein